MSNDDLKKYLEGQSSLSELYRESKRDGQSGTAATDDAVLAAAKRELGTQPLSIAQRVRRWSIPASTAAVVVISATLWLIQEAPVSRFVEPTSEESLGPVKKKSLPPEVSESDAASFADGAGDGASSNPKVMRQFNELKSRKAERPNVPSVPAPAMRAEAEYASDEAREEPAVSLDTIKGLIEAGRIDEARTALKHWIREHPDAALPEWAIEWMSEE